MNPEKRSLLKVTVDNYLEADKIFNILMGNQVDLRKDFIMSHSDMARLDI
jgi:DNA gyrase subunit B